MRLSAETALPFERSFWNLWARSKFTRTVSAAVILSASLFCIPQPSSAHPEGQLFRLRLKSEPMTLNWGQTELDPNLLYNTMRGLYRRTSDGKVEMDLASSVKNEKNFTRWIIELQSDVKWSDGAYIRAEQFVDAFQGLLKTTPQRARYPEIANLLREALAGSPTDSIRALSDRTLEFRFSRPLPYLPALLTHGATFPVREDLFRKYADYGSNPSHMAWLGSFKVQDWQTGVRLILTPNPHHSKKPWLQRIEAWSLPNESTAIQLFSKNHLEWAPLSDLSTSVSSGVIHAATSAITMLAIRNPKGDQHPLTSTRSGVLALSASLNREKLQHPALDICPPFIWKNLTTAAPAPPAFNDAHLDTISTSGAPALSRSLFREATGGDTEIVPLVLEYPQLLGFRELAEALSLQWKAALGISVIAKPAPQPQAALTLITHSIGFPDLASCFRGLAVEDDEFKKLLSKAAGETNSKARSALYLKASRRVLVEKPSLIPIQWSPSQVLVQPDVKGVSYFGTAGSDPVIDFGQIHY